VLIAEDGGIVSLSISGFQRPLAILVGQAEALALLHSAGADLRRPSTLATWRHCLAVRASPLRPPVLARPCSAVPGAPAKARGVTFPDPCAPLSTGQRATDATRVRMRGACLELCAGWSSFCRSHFWCLWRAAHATRSPDMAGALLQRRPTRRRMRGCAKDRAHAAGQRMPYPNPTATLRQAAGAGVERVVITRRVGGGGGTYYARIVLALPGGGAAAPRRLVSVDSRPSDSIALALQAGAALFVAKDLARRARQGRPRCLHSCCPHTTLPPATGQALRMLRCFVNLGSHFCAPPEAMIWWSVRALSLVSCVQDVRLSTARVRSWGHVLGAPRCRQRSGCSSSAGTVDTRNMPHVCSNDATLAKSMRLRRAGVAQAGAGG